MKNTSLSIERSLLLLTALMFVFLSGALWEHVRALPGLSAAVQKAVASANEQQPARLTAMNTAAQVTSSQPSPAAASISTPVCAEASTADNSRTISRPIPSQSAYRPAETAESVIVPPAPTPTQPNAPSVATPTVATAPAPTNTIAMTGANSINIIANITNNTFNTLTNNVVTTNTATTASSGNSPGLLEGRNNSTPVTTDKSNVHGSSRGASPTNLTNNSSADETKTKKEVSVTD
jgi:hypothetical protein